MNTAPNRHDLERSRAVIGRQIGLQFEDAKLGFLSEVLQRRLVNLAHPADLYLGGLERPQANGEFHTLAGDLTVGETYFFRNIEQFRALAEVVLPLRVKERAGENLRLLSAGCASGEEPYSMAIVAQETSARKAPNVDIRAVDLNPLALQKAQRARYSAWALRETPAETQARWFSRSGNDAVLDESLRAAVTFELGNLAADEPNLWRAACYDVIFCRNVLMYFSPEQMCAAVARIARALAPGGFLFLGHAETLRGVSDQFMLHHSHNTFYYQLKAGAGAIARRPPPVVPQYMPGLVPPAASDQNWYETIRKATERVANLMPGVARALPPSDESLARWDMAPAFEMLREERFDAALDHVRARPSAASRDPEALLLEATLLVHAGRSAMAEDACRRLLQVDEFNAGAHYLLALCCEHDDDLPAAQRHDHIAVYLDPQFAMPRLHLGLLATRMGDRTSARRELALALTLLGREDSSRLLLFGGGFGRDALMALCRSALRENEDKP